MDELMNQQAAMEIIASRDKIDTPERLADLRMNPSVPHYRNVAPAERVKWLGTQIFGLSVLAHIRVDASTVRIDATMLDAEIMDDSIVRDMTFVEMQEAFRKGVNGAYGEYYGITALSLLGFLRGFCNGEKRQLASAIVYKRRIEQERKADEVFFKALYQAQKEGKIEIPEFNFSTNKK